MVIIMVSHDLEFVRSYADHVLLLDRGTVKTGTPDEVFGSDDFKRVFPNPPLAAEGK